MPRSPSLMHYNSCWIVQASPCRGACQPFRTVTNSRRPAGVLVLVQQSAAEIPDRAERRLRRLAVRDVADIRQHQHLDRTEAFLLSNLDLPRGAEGVLLALDDQ